MEPVTLRRHAPGMTPYVRTRRYLYLLHIHHHLPYRKLPAALQLNLFV